MLQNELKGFPPTVFRHLHPTLSPLKDSDSPKKKYMEINISPPNIIEVSPLIETTYPPTPEWNQPRPAATTPKWPPLSAVRRSLVAGLGLHQLRGSDASTWCLKESDGGRSSDPTEGWLRVEKNNIPNIHAGLVYVVNVYMLIVV